MPGSILNADINFPHFTGEEKTDEKIDVITNYLYMLYEQLRYSLNNLGTGNFNEAELSAIGKQITDPLNVKLEDVDGRVTEISVDVDGIRTRVEDAEGDISTLDQRADSITARVENAEEDISTLEQTATGLTTRVTNAEGNISTLTQTAQGLSAEISAVDGRVTTVDAKADGISTRVTTAEGNISTLTQTASGLTTRVTSAEGNISTLTQTASTLSAQIESTNEDVSDLDSRVTTEVARIDAAASGISTRVSATETNITSLNGSVNTISGNLTTVTTRVTTVEQTASGLTSTVSAIQTDLNGTKTSVNSITQTLDGVVFSDSETGETVIDGSHITTGTISADRLSLTGAITWGDLTSNVQNTIYSMAYDAPGYLGTTYIDFNMVLSPRLIANQLNLYASASQATGSDNGTFNLYGYWQGQPRSAMQIGYWAGDDPRVTFGSSSLGAYAAWSFPMTYVNGNIDFFDGSKISNVQLASTGYGSTLPASGVPGQLFFLI